MSVWQDEISVWICFPQVLIFLNISLEKVTVVGYLRWDIRESKN